MRMDYALLSRLQLQSTSRPAGLPAVPADRRGRARSPCCPSRPANWAYPQPEMNDEEIAFCLVTGLPAGSTCPATSTG